MVGSGYVTLQMLNVHFDLNSSYFDGEDFDHLARQSVWKKSGIGD